MPQAPAPHPAETALTPGSRVMEPGVSVSGARYAWPESLSRRAARASSEARVPPGAPGSCGVALRAPRGARGADGPDDDDDEELLAAAASSPSPPSPSSSALARDSSTWQRCASKRARASAYC